jgi:hypothetical protein
MRRYSADETSVGKCRSTELPFGRYLAFGPFPNPLFRVNYEYYDLQQCDEKRFFKQSLIFLKSISTQLLKNVLFKY